MTPAHDKADFEIGLRHDLEIVDVLNPDGTINCPECSDLHGRDRFEVRELIASKLEDLDLLEKVEDYENNVGFSQRAGVPIEPRISMQWFLKYPEVERATRVVAEGEIVFRPDRWKKTYLHWLENIQDWCISRQLWWGHRVPVWYRRDKVDSLQEAESLDLSHLENGDIHVGVDPPDESDVEWVQDPDVMDTWFSSWLWPYATMDEPTQSKFYPTVDLCTGPDIIFFWVARMIMAGLEFKDEIPFSNVYFNSIVRDIDGRKMSKTLGKRGFRRWRKPLWGGSKSDFNIRPFLDLLLTSLGRLLGPLLGPKLALCWRPWSVLGRSWAILEPSWVDRRPIFDHLGTACQDKRLQDGWIYETPSKT